MRQGYPHLSVLGDKVYLRKRADQSCPRLRGKILLPQLLTTRPPAAATAIRDRSFSSAQSSDRPPTAASDSTTSIKAQPDTLPTATPVAPSDRKRPVLPRPDTNGPPSENSSKFVTPLTTPNERKDNFSGFDFHH